MTVKCLKIKSISDVFLLDYPRHYQIKEELLNLLENYSDIQRRETNVKATMTEWNINSKEIVFLKNYALNFLGEMHPRLKDMFEFKNFWANIYRKNDYAVEHDHKFFLFSIVYFLKVNKNSSPLIFSSIKTPLSLETKVKAKEGRLLIFPSHLKHRVPKHFSSETRITLSGNITLKL